MKTVGQLWMRINTMTNLLYSVSQCITALLLVCFTFVSGAHAGETITYIHADIAGSPIAASNLQGQVIWKESYKPYGARVANADQGKHGQWFTGKSVEPNTGLGYFGARYYDATLGRFMGVDPVGFVDQNVHSFNRYAYGNNNPLRYLDPDGNLPIAIPIAAYVFGNAAAGAGFDYGLQKAMGNTVSWGQVAFYGFVGGMFGGTSAVGTSAAMNTAKAASSLAAKEAANPVSETLARVVPGNLNPRILGSPSAADVFVTNASELRGLSAKQIAQKLSILESSSFRVIEFPSANVQGIASPIGRTNPGFIPGGRTAGGASEFVIPNGPIPRGAVHRIVP